MEYQRTKDSTMLYIQRVTFENDEYHVKTAVTLKEAKQLLEIGLEFVIEMQGVKPFRQRK